MSSTFHYTARTDAGGFVAGALHVESFEDAVAQLSARALFITSLEKEGTARGKLTAAFALGYSKASIRVVFFRSIATLLEAGVPLRRSLEVAARQSSDWRFREALHGVASDIDAGAPLSEALLKRPREFTPLFGAMVRAGEIGGHLDDVLSRIADLVERHDVMRKRVTAALTYPSVVFALAVGLVIFLVANVVPAFASMFTQMNVALPATTRILIVLGDALHRPVTWMMIAAAVSGVTMLWSALRRWRITAGKLDAIVLSIPVIGRILRSAAIARFARTLGTLLRSGVALDAAVDAAAEVVGTPRYEDELKRVSAALRLGNALGDCLAQSQLFEPLTLQLVSVGEETGKLDSMLLRVAEHHELDVETAVSSLGSVIEPALIVVLGIAVGTIVGSILLPLYSIIGSIK